MAHKKRKHHKSGKRRKLSGFSTKDIDLKEIGAAAAAALLTPMIETQAVAITSNTELQSAAPAIVGVAGLLFFNKNKMLRTGFLTMAAIGVANLVKPYLPASIHGILGTPLLGTPLLGDYPGIAEGNQNYPGIATRQSAGSAYSSGQSNGYE